MSKIKIVVVGTSAGGVNALKALFAAIPNDFEPPILIVQHFPERAESFMPHILSRISSLPFKHAEDGDPLAAQTVYIAPPGQHMLVEHGRIVLCRGPKENGNRPAIDPLFRTAAHCFGSSVAAVLLSGLLDDGTVGMAIVKRHGGVTIAQKPEEAPYGDMPSNAIEQGVVDHVAPIKEIAEILVGVAAVKVDLEDCISESVDPVEMDPKELKVLESTGKVSALTCPECHGTLFEMQVQGVLHYRCRVGHAYSSEKLLDQQASNLEAAIWIALRTLEENCDLLEHMIEKATKANREKSVDFLQSKLAFNNAQIGYLRKALDIELTSETS